MKVFEAVKTWLGYRELEADTNDHHEEMIAWLQQNVRMMNHGDHRMMFLHPGAEVHRTGIFDPVEELLRENTLTGKPYELKCGSLLR